MIYAIFVLTLLGFGGFHMWVKCAAGILIAFELLNTALKGKKKISFKQYTPLVLLFLMLITSLWAVDWSKNIEGILTGFVLFGWMLLWGVTNENDKEQLTDLIPYSGAAMTVISLLALLIKNFPVQLWQAERLGGLFQYSNTCALFLGLCIMLEANKRSNRKSNGKSNKKDVILSVVVVVILALGLLLTGSRGMLILMFGWAIFKLVRDKSHRKIFAIGIVSSLVLIIIAAAIGKSSQNLARLASILENNSTVWGRLLYYKDGLQMLMTHKFGMGYMGYYYVQGSMQTGVYTTKFVHNELLQMGLDYGIVAMLFAIAYLFIQLFKGKQSGVYKEYLAMIITASMIDFNLQYMLIMLMLVMFLDLNVDLKLYEFIYEKLRLSDIKANKEDIKNHKSDTRNHKSDTKNNNLNTKHNSADARSNKSAKASKKTSKSQSSTVAIFIFFAALVCMVYWLIVYGTLARHNYDAAGKLFAYNTEVLERQLAEADTTSEAMRLSDKILKINSCSFNAWLYRAYASQQMGDYYEMIACENALLDLDRYNVDVYKAYDNFISYIFAIDEQANTEPVKSMLLQEQKAIPDRLKSLEEVTSSLAYKIKDKPVFEYSNEQ